MESEGGSTRPTIGVAWAVVVGCVVGLPLTVSNVYVGLKTGWWESGQLTTTLLGFPILRALARAFGRVTSAEVVNLIQVTACALVAMPSVMGLLGAIPALELIGQTAAPLDLMGLGASLALVGVFVSSRLYDRLVLEERLPFPTGVATAELIRTLETSETEGGARGARPARAFAASGGVAALVTFLRDGPPQLIPAVSYLPLAVRGVSAETLGLGMNWSPLMLALGGIVGLRIAVSLLLGALVAWVLIAPRLVAAHVSESTFAALTAWLAWPGVGVLAGASLASVLRLVHVLAKRLVRREPRASSAVARSAAGEGRVRLGLEVASLVLGVCGVFAFSPPLFHLGAGALVVLLAAAPLLALVAARAAGKTDVAPLGAMGQLTQATFAATSVGGADVNLGGGAVVAGVSAQAVTGLWSWRSLEILGGSRLRVLVAHLVGIALGTAVAVPVYAIIVSGHVLGSAELPAPSAIQWKTFAELALSGTSPVGEGALVAIGLGLVLGVALDLGRGLRGVGRWLPDAGAFGVGFIAPPFYAVAIVIGAAAFALARRQGAISERQGDVLCSGAITLEALTGVLLALWFAR